MGNLNPHHLVFKAGSATAAPTELTPIVRLDDRKNFQF